MKLYPDGDGAGAGNGTADAGAGAGAGTGEPAAGAGAGTGAGAGAGTPAAKTYTQAEVDSFVRQASAARDGSWNKLLVDPEKGKEALQKLAAIHGVTLTEKEKENVAAAAATGDESELTPREKAMLERLEKLEGVHKSTADAEKERRANEAMHADISHAAKSIPYGRNPKLNGMVEDLILAAMIDPLTEKGTPTTKLAMGIQTALEKTLEEWAKDNGYVKDPNVAAGQPLRGGVSQSGVKPNQEPKDYDEVEAQTAATLRAMRGARR